MAPEQALGDAETDHRADLYALGVVAYEVLSGASPFSGRSAQALMTAHLTEPAKPIEVVRPDVPPALGSLVMHLLAKAPAERPQEATQVLRVLEDVRVAAGQRVIAHPTYRERVSKRVVIGAAAVLGVAAVVWLLLLPSRVAVPPAARSIAVLPFETGNADDEPFTDGLTDELIATLSRVPTLRVVARTSSFALKGKKLGIRAIADTLHVNMLIKGSVRRDQERLKVSAQLVDARDTRVVWSQTYDRDRRDIFAVQQQIARDVATTLSIRLSGTDSTTRLTERPTEDFEAYQLYRKGRYYQNLRRESDLHLAVQYFAEAGQRDPGFARAYAGLADAFSELGIFGYARPHDVFPRARAAAEHAIALDPKLGEAHGALAQVLFNYEWNWKAAEESFKTAVVLDPKNTQIRLFYSAFLWTQSRGEEALAQLRVVREFDPLSPAGALSGRVQVSSRRPDAAIRDVEETLELYPRSELALQVLGHAYLQKGMNDKAIKAFRQAAALSGVRDSAHLAYAYAVTGHRADGQRLIETLVSSDRNRYLPPFHIALAYAGLGDKDAAIRWLGRGYDEHASFMEGLNVTRGFDGLRSDPRFVALLKRMHF
jgi:serine/threonine-protein kinase